MKEPLKLIVNVTRDKRVHEILENNLARNNVVSGMFERKYVMSRDELLSEAPSANVFFTFALPEQAVSAADNLKWVHFASAGVEKSLNPTLLARKDVKLSGSTGIHAATIAEYILMMMLAFSRNLRKAYQFQEKHEWHFEDLIQGKFDLEGKTVGIIGLGSIGLRVARLAKAFEMKVIGTVNRPRKLPYVEKSYSPSKLDIILKQADFVVLSAPLTEETFHIAGEHEFSIMKSNAYLINIGRGRLVDEEALIAALQAKKIAGAALDVFEHEPLPADSPLWEMENVSVTPHYSGMAEDLWSKVAQRFCENAIRFKQGKRMIGVVSRKKGY
jgi:phosphoglycerate dehydrogenase-like enzyme